VRIAASLALVLVAAALVVVAFARFHDGPLGPLPGGALRTGGLARVPEDWSPWAGVPTLELETRPDSPWSVTTWFVVEGGKLYASADFLNPGKRWPHFVQTDPRVIVRLDDGSGAGATGRTSLLRFECRAVRVEEPSTVAALRKAFARKYDIAPDGIAARTQVWFFRLDPR
jgi:hypothetical protein